VPSIGSTWGPILVLVGLGLGPLGLAKLDLYLYLGVAVFQLVTLPVGFDASRKVMEFLRRMGFLTEREAAPRPPGPPVGGPDLRGGSGLLPDHHPLLRQPPGPLWPAGGVGAPSP